MNLHFWNQPHLIMMYNHLKIYIAFDLIKFLVFVSMVIENINW